MSAVETKSREGMAARYIRLLGQLEHATEPMFTGTSDSLEDLLGFVELVRDHFIDGHIERNAQGRPTRVHHMTITVRGRLLLEELRGKEAFSTSAGILKASKWSIYRFLLTALVGGSIGYLIRSLG